MDYSKSPYRPPFIGRNAPTPPVAAPIPFPKRPAEPVREQPRAA